MRLLSLFLFLLAPAPMSSETAVFAHELIDSLRDAAILGQGFEVSLYDAGGTGGKALLRRDINELVRQRL